MKIDQPISIFAIIVTFNGSKTISDCLDSLVNSGQPLQTIVIDNSSTDNTRSLIQKYQDLIVFLLDKNIGFGQANNIGLKYALEHGADFVFLLNQDAIIKPDTIELLIDIAANNPEFGILSPIHLNGDGSQIDYNLSNYIFRGNQRFISDCYFNNLQVCYSVPFINAAAWLISKECLMRVGGFDELFFMYGEDNDFCHRAILNNFKIGLVPRSVIYHKRIINLPENTGWSDLKQKAKREAVLATVDIISSRKKLIKAVLFWAIDNNSRIGKQLINRNWKEIAVQLLAKWFLYSKLPRIWKHRKDIHKIAQDSMNKLNPDQRRFKLVS